ncbi:MAG: PhnD/SsuA/transferrin family substrate-binding protein [Candidatus Heimdallarchaeota archaeon]|nr:PhnD/SsuA/transferrin family substrate-binding protein [Candidatus Heimdallarchaeota archaeon]MDH5644726.1 PhnD/SsuA/transferrin family substrate-binding protein [Candidatus Heimdallarchaeota archaeon]
MTKQYMISKNTLIGIAISTFLIGIIIGGIIGYFASPTDGENFDLPEMDSFRMGFMPTSPENVDTVTTNAEELASFLSSKMGIDVEIYPITNGYEDLILAFQNGQIDAAFMDGGPAHFVIEGGWGNVMLAELRSANNQPYYDSVAWVRANSNIDSLSTMLDGSYISSHTSATGTAGMIMPIGTLIDEGYMQTQSDDDTQTLLARYFASSEIGGSYGGALQRVLDGQADVAFVRDTTPTDLFPDRVDELRLLHTFGRVPSHPIVVSSQLAEGWRFRFVNAMLELNMPENVDLLSSLYGAPGLVGANNVHIKDLSDAIRNLPWLEDEILG